MTTCNKAGMSCALILGVIGNGLQPTSESQFTLTFFNDTNRLNADTFIEATSANGSEQVYWFLLNQTPTWQFIASLKPLAGQANLFITIPNGRNPTINDNDYQSKNFQANFIQISSSDTNLVPFARIPRMLFIVKVIPLTAPCRYQFIFRGPSAITASTLPFVNL